MNRPRKKRKHPIYIDDPLRALAAAVAAKAVEDYLWPAKHLPDIHRLSAVEFCQSDEGQALIEQFGIPKQKIEQVLIGRAE